jgi:hypothetical protein
MNLIIRILVLKKKNQNINERKQIRENIGFPYVWQYYYVYAKNRICSDRVDQDMSIENMLR